MRAATRGRTRVFRGCAGGSASRRSTGRGRRAAGAMPKRACGNSDEMAAQPAKARWQPFGWMSRWMALHPAWSGAALVLFGAVMGVEVLPVLRATAQFENGPAVNVSAGPRITNEELAHLAVAGVNFAPG